MVRWLGAFILLALVMGCHAKPHGVYAESVPGPANPVVPVDPSGNYPAAIDLFGGDSLNTSVVQNTPASSGVLIDAGTRYVLAANWTNEGTATGWAQIFCGQLIPDAGGTNDAGTVPSIQVRCPAGTICGTGRLVAPVSCGAGAVWYSSSTSGSLTIDAGVPNMTLLQAALR